MAFDYKKEYKDLYQPKTMPAIVMVPAMRFVAVDGVGDPNEEGGDYAKAMQLLYGISFTVKMSKKSRTRPSISTGTSTTPCLRWRAYGAWGRVCPASITRTKPTSIGLR